MTVRLTVIDRKPFAFTYKNQNGSDWGSSLPPPKLESYWARSERAFSDATKPGFVKKVGQKRLPKRATLEDHPYQVYKQQWICPRSGLWDTYADVNHEHLIARTEATFYQLLGEGLNSTFDASWDNNDEIALVGKLREKIVGSDFDMGVLLGEGKEALSLIASTAVRTRKFLTGLRRGDVTAISEALGVSKRNVAKATRVLHTKKSGLPTSVALSEANLALQYGWMPLLKDAEGAAQALAQQLNNPAVQTYKARSWKPLFGHPNSSVVTDWKYSGRLRAQLIGRLTEVNVAGLNGLVDPSSVLWELTPWSFVADWFIPIGNYLSARSLSNFVSGTFVKTIHQFEYYHAENGIAPNVFLDIFVQPNIDLATVRTVRTVSSVLDVPLPNFKKLSDVPSWRRATNAVSLLVTGAWRHLK